ncbi:MAG: phosphatidylinositol-specific phospholipase C domain-containing protein [Clostridia bacterium]|nr:phosphatidylinositol-specific phospholipase C domain-containing protein [Clostridia bacterium]
MVLSQLGDDILLSQINLAGTHDSCTAFVSMENMSRCQLLTVKEQLSMGIRLFDIRLNRSGEEFYLVHSLADCFSDKEKKSKLTFGEVLKDFREFLIENPLETIVVSVKQDRGIMSRSFFPAFYNKYIKGSEDEWYLKNENPSLSDCRGKMVLMRRCKVWRSFLKGTDAGLDFSYWKDQSGKRKTTPELVILSCDRHHSKDALLSAVVQDRYSLAPGKKWHDCAKPFLDGCVTEPGIFSLHFISTSHRKKGETLVETASEMNSFFSEYELRKNEAQGWFFLDFPTKELCDKIMKSNFGIYEVKEK